MTVCPLGSHAVADTHRGFDGRCIAFPGSVLTWPVQCGALLWLRRLVEGSGLSADRDRCLGRSTL